MLRQQNTTTSRRQEEGMAACMGRPLLAQNPQLKAAGARRRRCWFESCCGASGPRRGRTRGSLGWCTAHVQNAKTSDWAARWTGEEEQARVAKPQVECVRCALFHPSVARSFSSSHSALLCGRPPPPSTTATAAGMAHLAFLVNVLGPIPINSRTKPAGWASGAFECF